MATEFCNLLKRSPKVDAFSIGFKTFLAKIVSDTSRCQYITRRLCSFEKHGPNTLVYHLKGDYVFVWLRKLKVSPGLGGLCKENKREREHEDQHCGNKKLF